MHLLTGNQLGAIVRTSLRNGFLHLGFMNVSGHIRKSLPYLHEHPLRFTLPRLERDELAVGRYIDNDRRFEPVLLDNDTGIARRYIVQELAEILLGFAYAEMEFVGNMLWCHFMLPYAGSPVLVYSGLFGTILSNSDRPNLNQISGHPRVNARDASQEPERRERA